MEKFMGVVWGLMLGRRDLYLGFLWWWWWVCESEWEWVWKEWGDMGEWGEDGDGVKIGW